MIPIVAAYDDELARLGKVRPPEVSIIRHCYVAKDRETALEEVAPHIEGYYKQFGGWGLFRDVIKSGPEQPDPATILQGRVVFGGPDDVANQLRRYQEHFGVNQVFCRVGWPSMDNRLVSNAVRLLGSEVLPRLRA